MTPEDCGNVFLELVLVPDGLDVEVKLDGVPEAIKLDDYPHVAIARQMRKSAWWISVPWCSEHHRGEVSTTSKHYCSRPCSEASGEIMPRADTVVPGEATIEDLLKEFGTPDKTMPAAPPWHVESDACLHGWIIGGVEWGSCDCEDPANPWPSRAQGDGPRDCECFGCMGHKPRHERGRLAGCEYKNHHCDDCHENRRCTVAECDA